MSIDLEAPENYTVPGLPLDARDLLAALGGASAAIVHADAVSTYGSQTNGLVNLTLQAERHVVLPSVGLTSDSVAVAHLRLTPRAVQGLRSMLADLDQRAKEVRNAAN